MKELWLHPCCMKHLQVLRLCALHSPCSDEDFQLHCNCLDDDHVLLPAILASKFSESKKYDDMPTSELPVPSLAIVYTMIYYCTPLSDITQCI